MPDQIQTNDLLPNGIQSFPLDSLLLIIFLCVLAGYIIFSVILHYHWQQYSANAKMTVVTFVLYGATTLPLIGLMGIMALTL